MDEKVTHFVGLSLSFSFAIHRLVCVCVCVCNKRQIAFDLLASKTDPLDSVDDHNLCDNICCLLLWMMKQNNKCRQSCPPFASYKTVGGLLAINALQIALHLIVRM